MQQPPPPKKQRKRRGFIVVLIALLCTLAFGLLACFLAANIILPGVLSSIFSVPQIISVLPTPTPVCQYTRSKTDYKITGKPTINPAFINKVFDYYQSPAQGKGQALYDDGVAVGIDPAYALAFFLEESTLGTKGIATVTHALGNIRANPGEPQYKGYRQYATWEEGFKDWYRLLSHEYIGKGHLHTVDQIIPVYAPSEDKNDVEGYISTVKLSVDKWRSGCVAV